MATTHLLHPHSLVKIAKPLPVGIPLKSYVVLCKVGIAALSTFSAAAGFFLGGGEDIALLLSTLLGIFLIACGAASINQIQEVSIDALMERTKGRPLVTGIITKPQATFFAALLIAIGLLLLFFMSGVMAACLGAFAILWYNGVYTPLKRVTTMAFLPGGIVGAIPPMIGWVANGSHLFEEKILCLSLLLFMWQIPHFWLLLVRYGRQYQEAGLPSLCDRLTKKQIARMTLVWIAGIVAATALFPLFGVIANVAVMTFVALSGLLLLITGLVMIWGRSIERSSRLAFHAINSYMLITLVAVSFS